MQKVQKTLDRTRNFRKRVSAEREVLAMVNGTRGAPELLGLTEAAITDWTNRFGADQQTSVAVRAKAILLSIARETGTISDQSREVLSQDEMKSASPKLLEALQDGLKEISECASSDKLLP